MKQNFKILVINPGSTSTKLSLYENEQHLVTASAFHDSSVLKQFPTINDQLDFRMQSVWKFLEDNHIHVSEIDGVAARGGPSYSVPGGVYEVTDLLIQDTMQAKGGLYHASMLGVQMAKRVAEQCGCIVVTRDPTVVDEYCDLARVTGIDGITRSSATHALNLKGISRKHAKSVGKTIEEMNLILCHIDGGITIMAQHHGRMIDGNNGGGGDGPFTPTRMGSMAISDVIEYLWEKPKSEMKNLISVTGGLSSYFNTSNCDVIHEMVKDNDPKAVRVWQAMIYQICKQIGAMSTVLSGHVDGIVLTGGLVRFDDIVEGIKERCEWIAPVSVYPNEIEQDALAQAALSVLNGEILPKKYTGKPVWNGFTDERQD